MIQVMIRLLSSILVLWSLNIGEDPNIMIEDEKTLLIFTIMNYC